MAERLIENLHDDGQDLKTEPRPDQEAIEVVNNGDSINTDLMLEIILEGDEPSLFIGC